MWKDIPEWEDYYEVNEKGEVRNKQTLKLIEGDVNNAGYYRVALYHKPNKKRFFRHRLVAQLFIPNPNNYAEVNHIDGDKSNNCVDNLEWCNRSYNEREARRLGIKSYHPFQATFLDGTIKQYEFAVDLAKEINVTGRTVLNYLQGKSHGYINYGIKEIQYL